MKSEEVADEVKSQRKMFSKCCNNLWGATQNGSIIYSIRLFFALGVIYVGSCFWTNWGS